MFIPPIQADLNGTAILLDLKCGDKKHKGGKRLTEDEDKHLSKPDSEEK